MEQTWRWLDSKILHIYFLSERFTFHRHKNFYTLRHYFGKEGFGPAFLLCAEVCTV